MNKFNRGFKRHSDEFEREWQQHKRNMWVVGVISTVIGLGVLGFTIWVIVSLVRFYGVV